MYVEKRTVWAAVAALAASAAGMCPIGARADSPPSGTMLAAVDTPTVTVARGSRYTLPLDGVTRVIAEDDDVARGRFVNGRAIIEGVTTGSTVVEVYQGTSKRRWYIVRVNEPGIVPPAGTVVNPLPPSTGSPATITPNTPVVVASGESTAARPSANGAPTPLVPGRSNLAISLRVSPVEENPAQALFTITYANRGTTSVRGVVIRSAIDDVVSYVTGSGTSGARYDAAARELVWNIGTLEAGSPAQSVSFRVKPIENGPATFFAVATIEDASGVPVSSNAIKYTNQPTALLTVFALPDRFLAGLNTPVHTDVRGAEYQQAVDRLVTMGVLRGREVTLFEPSAQTQRAEYAVMTLRGLNLKDLRDISAIKFVLSRRSVITLDILNNQNKSVASLVKNQPYPAGEHTVIWNGSTGTGYAPPGRYTYVCTAKDVTRNETTRLQGIITVVPQTPLLPAGLPTFVDVKPSDWYAGYLAVAEKQNLVEGYPNKTFRPMQPINRVEATAIVVRAIGLGDLARRSMDKSPGFLDEHNIPPWSQGYVYVASTIAKSSSGKLIVGYPSNFYMPMKPLRRDEAAIITQRLIDKETNRRIAVSGQMVPGATVTINGRIVEADDQGRFSFVIEQNTTQPTSVAVTDSRSGNW